MSGHAHKHDHSDHHDHHHDHDHEHSHSHDHDEKELTPREKELLSFVQSIREPLADVSPHLLAKNTGIPFDEELSVFDVAVLGRNFAVLYPSFHVHEAGVEHHEATTWVQALLMHYFRTADGSPLKNNWISFHELPGGMLYEKAFQGYTGDKLAKGIENNIDLFSDVCRKMRGTQEQIGDIAFKFSALPRVMVTLAYWLGDEDFPPSAKVLFDESAPHYLPTDAYAALGGRLCNNILFAAGLLSGPNEEHD